MQTKGKAVPNNKVGKERIVTFWFWEWLNGFGFGALECALEDWNRRRNWRRKRRRRRRIESEECLRVFDESLRVRVSESECMKARVMSEARF